MTIKTALLRGAAFGVLSALAAGASAHAEAADTHHHHRHHVAAKTQESATSQEISALRAEVEALKSRLDSQGQQQQATAAQVAQTQSQVQEVAASSEAAQDKIETIPEQVNVAIGQLPKPKTDKLYYRGVGITLGGFLEAAGIYRSRSEEADVASNYNAIPYSGPNTGVNPGTSAGVGHTQELRFSARQSRISGLVEADADPVTHLAMYGEFDFLGAAQTANSNESNSYNLRIRNLYGTVDRTDLGLHFLFGQNWSLVTLNQKGITPRNELTPPQIDAQYVPGFTWARQPQFRVADQLTPEFWIAASVENPQTTFAGGTTALPAAIKATYQGSAGSNFNSANTLSLNHIPDVVAKVAYEPKLFDRQFHFEAFGLFRAFYDREASGIATATNGGITTLTASTTGFRNQNVYGGGGGFGMTAQVLPKVLDFQVSGLFGSGVGRYGSVGLPDVTFKYDGTIQPIQESMLLAGVTYHYSKAFDFYAFAGQEQEDKNTSVLNTGAGNVGYGYGNGLYNNTGCEGEVTTATACAGNTHTVEQVTTGFWDKVYSGSFGQLRFGMQYSFTERKAFPGVGGIPSGDENMIFTSIRYYPFQ
jgi:hypothetical protein